MKYLAFTLWFTVIHTVAYVLAGAISLRFSKTLYEGESRVLDFLRDMADPAEVATVNRRMFAAQLLRGALMSVVLYPILGWLEELAFGLQFVFFAGLMFVYTDLASAVPFPSNIEGLVYTRDGYRQSGVFARLQAEMLIYTLIFGLAASWLAV